MAKISYAQRIRSRIKELEEKFSELRIELDELRVAEKVLNRLGDDVDEADVIERSESSNSTIANDILITLNVLQHASTIQIHQALNEQIRPGVSLSSVAATLSRMRAKNVVDNQNGKWFVVSDALGSIKPLSFNPNVSISQENNPEREKPRSGLF